MFMSIIDMKYNSVAFQIILLLFIVYGSINALPESTLEGKIEEGCSCACGNQENCLFACNYSGITDFITKNRIAHKADKRDVFYLTPCDVRFLHENCTVEDLEVLISLVNSREAFPYLLNIHSSAEFNLDFNLGIAAYSILDNIYQIEFRNEIYSAKKAMELPAETPKHAYQWTHYMESDIELAIRDYIHLKERIISRNSCSLSMDGDNSADNIIDNDSK